MSAWTERLQGEAFGPYTNLRVIGNGSFGTVYEAHDRKQRRQVAIKVQPHPYGDSSQARYERARLAREVNMLTRVLSENASNVVNIYETWCATLNGVTHTMISMPLYHITLSRAFRRSNATWFPARLFAQLVHGTDHLHRLGVMHRDLSPANIGLDDANIVHIFDLGAATPSNGKCRTMTCTRWYRAPEMFFHGEVYNNAVDVWSIGCIVSEVLENQPLFGGTTDLLTFLEIFRANHTANVPRTISELYAIQPHALLFETDGDDRRLVLRDIERVLQINPIHRATTKEVLADINADDLEKPVLMR